jgi:hypothetical protein
MPTPNEMAQPSPTSEHGSQLAAGSCCRVTRLVVGFNYGRRVPVSVDDVPQTPVGTTLATFPLDSHLGEQRHGENPWNLDDYCIMIPWDYDKLQPGRTVVLGSSGLEGPQQSGARITRYGNPRLGVAVSNFRHDGAL